MIFIKIKEFDTIAAIATSFGEGGIGIIRISGSDAFFIADKIFTPFSKEKKDLSLCDYKSHTLTYGNIIYENNIIDEVLLSVMKAPNSYTCENVVEINCHGGKTSVKKILQAVLKSGARLAENGEFTKRAFLNGRIDLSKAEAVIDIINSKSDIEHSSAINRLSGKLYEKISLFRNEILTMLAHIEASIDYPEHDDEMLTYQSINTKTCDLIEKINYLIKTCDTGRIIKSGIKTVILGKPNVGKSSILNFILDEDRAIISNIAGTTRDIIKEDVNINGVPLNIVDTAGIRQTSDEIEKIGILKAKELAQDADLILLIFDNSEKLCEEDMELLNFVKNKKTIAIINKIDLNTNIDTETIYSFIPKENVLQMSTKTKIGFELFSDKIEKLFFDGQINLNDDVLISSERNKSSLFNCVTCLNNVISTIKNGMPEDFISMDLLEAYKFLGEITGETLDEDIIDKIFSEFCLGK